MVSLAMEGMDVELMPAAQVLGINIYNYHICGKECKCLKFHYIAGVTPPMKKAMSPGNFQGNRRSDHFDYVLAAYRVYRVNKLYM